MNKTTGYLLLKFQANYNDEGHQLDGDGSHAIPVLCSEWKDVAETYINEYSVPDFLADYGYYDIPYDLRELRDDAWTFEGVDSSDIEPFFPYLKKTIFKIVEVPLVV